MWSLTLATIAAGAEPKAALEHYAEAQDTLGEADLSDEGRRAEYERLLATQNRVRSITTPVPARPTPP